MATKTTKPTRKKGDRRPGLRFIVNSKGEKTEVVLPIALYEQMLEELEDAEDIRDAKEAMKDADFIPWEEAKTKLGL